jgi:hypothetical protein
MLCFLMHKRAEPPDVAARMMNDGMHKCVWMCVAAGKCAATGAEPAERGGHAEDDGAAVGGERG